MNFLEKCAILYQAVLNTINFSKKDLEVIGFSENEINTLLEHKILKKMSDVSFSFIGVNNLFLHGREKMRFSTTEGILFFKRCEELDSSFTRIIYRKLSVSIDKKNSSLALAQIKELSKRSRKDADLLLLLFYYVYDMPNKNVKELDEIYNRASLYEDHLSKYIVSGQFRQARVLQNVMMQKNNKENPERDMVFKNLKKAAIDKELEVRDVLNDLACCGNVLGLFQYLLNLKKNTYLTFSEKHFFFLAQDILEMEKTGIAKQRMGIATELFSAIRFHDYETGWALADDYCANHGSNGNALAFFDLLQIAFHVQQSLLNIPDIVEIPLHSNVDITMGNVPIVQKNYDLIDLDAMLDAIVNYKASFAQVAVTFCLNENQISILQLVMAKYFMQCGNFDIAKVLIDMVEVKKYKSKSVKKLLDEVSSMSEIKIEAMSPFLQKVRSIKLESLLG